MAKETIGFIGLGNMGAPMACCLARAGFRLRLYDILPQLAVPVVKVAPHNIEVITELHDVGSTCDAVITMLPDAAIVHSALLGEAGAPGAVSALRPETFVIDMSSSAPLATRSLGEELQKHKIGLIDAPVSGGVTKARDGSLTIMTGGDEDLVARAAPILSAMGQVQRTGPLGSGHATKALNNYVSAAALLAVSEALIIAERFGLDPHVVNGVINASTGRNNTTERKAEQYMLNHAFNSGFALALMKKDVGMALELAEKLDLNAPGVRSCSKLLDAADAALGPGADHTAVHAYLETRLTDRS